MKCSSLIIFLSFVGCASGYDHLDLDYKYTDEELLIIKDSIKEWTSATGSESAGISYTENVVIGDGFFGPEDIVHDFGTGTMQKVSIYDPGYQVMIDYMGSNGLCGVGAEGQTIITITECFYNKKDELKSEFFHAVLLHELGHFFGLEHGTGALMLPGSVVHCIDQDSLNKFCDIHGDCNGSKTTCE